MELGLSASLECAGAQDGSCYCGRYLPKNNLQLGTGDSWLKLRLRGVAGKRAEWHGSKEKL